MKSPIGDYDQFTGHPHSWREQMFCIGHPFAFEAGTPTRRDESSGMKDNKRREKPRISGRAGPELRIVGIDCNPGPDAEDRLRRLFAILVKLAARDDERPPQTDVSPDGGSEAEG